MNAAGRWLERRRRGRRRRRRERRLGQLVQRHEHLVGLTQKAEDKHHRGRWSDDKYVRKDRLYRIGIYEVEREMEKLDPHLLQPPGSWMPGAEHRHGTNAGYRVGRHRREVGVCHFTVGRDSTAIGDRGYFHFLIRRNGAKVQFAEVGAITWHAGEWNDAGYGIEVEYYEPTDGPHPGGIFTPAQLAACGEVVRWCAQQTGVPLIFYHGPRIREGTYRGHITHGSLIQSQQHWDYWSHDQWNRMIGGGVTPEEPKKIDRGDPEMVILQPAEWKGPGVLVADSWSQGVSAAFVWNAAVGGKIPILTCNAAELEQVQRAIVERNQTGPELAMIVEGAVSRALEKQSSPG